MYFDELTFQTISPIVRGEEGQAPAITQIAVAISDANLAIPIPVALIAESYASRCGRG